MIEKVGELLGSCGSDCACLPPTLLYNEGWLLRLVLDWFADHPDVEHPFMFLPGAHWYSEALLTSRFLPERRGDPRAESFTHGDGIIGHFSIRPGERAEATVLPDARQLVVVEVKMGSALSSGVTNSRNYDQAARNVACMAQMLADRSVKPESLDRLGFYVVAPAGQIEAGVFGQLVTKASIHAKVSERVAQYDGKHDAWFREAFEPLLERIDVDVLSWESALELVESEESGRGIREFYSSCRKFNPQRGGRAV